MSKATVYNLAGEKVSEKDLDPKVFNVEIKPELVQQAVVAQQANARVAIAHTKGRADVRGGGKKPWRQKGTGRARHGSRRSPIWIGGGVTFGPTKERNFSSFRSSIVLIKSAILAFLSSSACTTSSSSCSLI